MGRRRSDCCVSIRHSSDHREGIEVAFNRAPVVCEESTALHGVVAPSSRNLAPNRLVTQCVGRIYIELATSAFLDAGGTPDQFRAGIARAVGLSWLWRHESGTYVKFTAAGAELFS
jgi:hypothetical protein